MAENQAAGDAVEMVRVLNISQLFKEHITDLIIELSEKAARQGFNEDAFDVFGYVDRRDTAYLRLEARPIERQPGTGSVLRGAYTTPFREVTADYLRAWDAGYLCIAPRNEIEMLVAAPSEFPQYPRFLTAVVGWKKQEHF